jgi:bifunctional UDP-N-acetylglucosamine pyrophosphorylase/glucosamine-1-phosphate N-acetyltransferase
VSSQRRSKTNVPNDVPAIVLAAGKGTRLRGREPKAAVQLGGRPMAARVCEAMRGGGASRIIVVVGHRGDDVRAALGDNLTYVVQEEQLGTGHAALQAAGVLAGYSGPVLIAYGDIPLLRDSDAAGLLRHHLKTGAAATLLTAIFHEPGTLGRIIRGPRQRVQGIVEARDASPEQLKIREINVGVYCFTAPLIFQVLGQVTNDNAQRQYYLTDAIGILVRGDQRVEAIPLEVAHAGIGVDTAEDLTRAERLWTGAQPGT